MASRRTRYRATLVKAGEINERLIRAYTAEQVREHYSRLGYIVCGVIKEPRASRGASVPMNWKLDRAALREAIEFLGITYPVEVKQTRVAGGRHGAHCLIPHGRFVRRYRGGWYGVAESPDGTLSHKVTVKSWLDPERASFVLWHELTHCMQAERAIARECPNGTLEERWEAWHRSPERGHRPNKRRRIAYDAREIEREANRFADDFSAELPLAA